MVNTSTRSLDISTLQAGLPFILEDELGGRTELLIIDPAKSLFRRLHPDVLDPPAEGDPMSCIQFINSNRKPHDPLRFLYRNHCIWLRHYPRNWGVRRTLPIVQVTTGDNYPHF